MSELLLELLSEEIPAMMQRKAEISYKKIFEQYFSSLMIRFTKIEVNVGPRRVCLYVKGLPSIIPSTVQDIKGPKISSPHKAVDGFCQSHNIGKETLYVKEINKIHFYCYKKHVPEQQTENILVKTLSTPISRHIWPKSMYWGNHKIKWIRPLKNIICIFDGKIIPFCYGHLQANNICYGHKFMSPDSAAITSYDEYKKYLKANFVILKSKDRITKIKSGIAKIIKSTGLIIKEDPSLFEELSGLVEYPNVLLGKIEKEFVSTMPDEILISAMRKHQKYFSVFDNKGYFAPYFIFVSNIQSTTEKTVISGNEKVLSARLSDAKYLYDQDLKTTKYDQSLNLSKVIFHADLGSLQDKTLRLAELCKVIDQHDEIAAKAALICKNDLVSEIVSEFPNLQGVMGYYYAISSSQNKKIAQAIYDHYKPQGPNDCCPKEYSGALLAIADKIDSLCGLILIGKKPSGSKDPYALRRKAIGIIRIILEHKIDIDLYEVILHSLGLYNDKFKTHDNMQEILLFITERMKYFFKSIYNPAVVDASLDLSKEASIIHLVSKMHILNDFMHSHHGKNVMQVYKRINNALKDKPLNGQVNEFMLMMPHEQELFECIKRNKIKIQMTLDNKDYKSSLRLLTSFYTPISNFFTNILVQDSNELITHNRRLLLEETRKIFNQIAQFNKLS